MRSSAHKLLQRLVTHDPVNGAYTQLFAGLHPSITMANSGGWGECTLIKFRQDAKANMLAIIVSPFGKTEDLRKDLADASQSKKYWEWSEAQVGPFM
jgi:hypothetical protein